METNGKKAGTLIVIAGLFIGFGLSTAIDTAAGIFLGLGIGFLAAFLYLR